MSYEKMQSDVGSARRTGVAAIAETIVRRADPTPAVVIDGLRHRYGQRVALDGLTLSIDRGELFGFLGPNGSGKTTLFRILCTLIAAPAGTVRMLGLDIAAGRDAIRRQIGVVFQSPSLDKQLTADENLRCHGHLYGIRGAELSRRIDELLERLKLSDRRHDRVGSFSGGMRRRVELAKGLLNRPAILLLDEPSTGLDPGARIDLWKILRDIQAGRDVTILLTTHLMDEADRCNRLAILDQGKLVACDTPDALKERIGGDVITLSCGDPVGAAAAIRERFGVEVEQVDKTLRLERASGHQFVPQLIEALPGMFDSVSVGKPTLEDVFIRVTGHGFVRAGE
jgi:ABC-2 type transport system ATP-binding protein